MRLPFTPLLMATFIGWCSISASAQELPVALRACAAESDATLRLACYDRQIPPQKPAPAPASVVPPQSAPPAAAAAAAPAAMRHITSISVRARAPAEYTLDNGEVWRQVDNSPFWVDVGEAVTIQRGAVGGLWMQTDARHGTRVSRVR
jgi:hypothetical protein